MQALEFELVIGGRALHDGRHGVSIVGRELTIKCVRLRKHFGRTRQVGNIRIRLAREHRIIGKTLHLRALDFGIPISALHQTRHDAATMLRGQCRQPIDHMACALLICLHSQTQAFITFKSFVRVNRGKNIERYFEPFSFFRVERNTNPAIARQLG